MSRGCLEAPVNDADGKDKAMSILNETDREDLGEIALRTCSVIELCCSCLTSDLNSVTADMFDYLVTLYASPKPS